MQVAKEDFDSSISPCAPLLLVVGVFVFQPHPKIL